ncbi:hemicentin-2-like [Lissotriton helveticus]
MSENISVSYSHGLSSSTIVALPLFESQSLCKTGTFRIVCLGACVQLSSAQGADAEVTNAGVGETVTLTAPVIANTFSFAWYRGTVVASSRIICTYFVSPPSQVTGAEYTGRETCQSDGSLVIRDLLMNYSGNYTTQVIISGAPPVQVTRELRVYENVFIPVIQAVTQNPVENGSLVLVCNASGTDVSYQWYQDGKLITSGGRINTTSNNQTLTLSPCTRNDTGTNFTCRASNAVSHSTGSQYTLTVSYGPDTPVISVSPKKSAYAAGSTITFSCKAPSHPPALYTWLLNGQSLLNTGSELAINSLTLNDSGNYTCNTSNSVTHLSKYAIWGMRVLDPVTKPTVSSEPSQLVENRGPAKITCNASKAATTILWSFNKSPDLPGNIFPSPDNRTLSIANVSRVDSGIYQCEAMNPVSSSASDPRTLSVAYGPEDVLINAPVSQLLQEGTKLSLSCTAGSIPAPQYQWLLNSTDLNRPYNTYTVEKMSSRDNGNYMCVAYNTDTGLTVNTSVSIIVNGMDFPPAASPSPCQCSCSCSCPSWMTYLGMACGVVLGAAMVVALVVLRYERRLSQYRSDKGEPTYQNSNNVLNPETHCENTRKGPSGQTVYQDMTEDSAYMELRYKDEAVYEKINRKGYRLQHCILAPEPKDLTKKERKPHRQAVIAHLTLHKLVNTGGDITFVIEAHEAWLGVWIQLTSGQESGAEVVTAAVGQTATLTAPFTRNKFIIYWYRGTATNNDALIFTYVISSGLQTPADQYTGRESGSQDGSLRITDLRTSDSGSYTAAIPVWFVPRLPGAPRQLRVLENVSIPVIQAVTQDPVENGSLVLVCNASGTDVSYQWYQDDKLITSGGRINITKNTMKSQTLTLSPCTRNDTATSFTCGASNAVSNSTSSQYTLTVSYGPDTPVISACPGQPVYLASSALTLSCKASSHPPALYTWLLNGQSLSKSGPGLHFNSLTLTDSGNYTCNTSNNVTHLSNQATWGIRVLEPVTKPTVKYISSQLVENRGPAEIACDTSTAAVTILWYFNCTSALPGNIIQSPNNRTLTMFNISRGDSWIYQCVAMNPGSSKMSDPQTLTIAYGPEDVKIDPPGSQWLQVGTKLSFACTAGSFPAPEYQWLLNGTDLKRPGSTYTIEKVSSQDDGNYTCVAENTVTGLSVEASVFITANGSPCPTPDSCWQTTVGVACGVLLGAAVIVAVMAVHYERRLKLKDTNKDENVYQNPSVINEANTQYENVRKEREEQSANLQIMQKIDYVANVASS